jgi:predicted nucleic acid-binding protein
MGLDEAADLCLDLWDCRQMEKINPTLLTPNEVFKQVKEQKLVRGKIFDAIIAVMAKENKVGAIYTENVADFEKYNFIKTLNPFGPNANKKL